MDTAVSAHGFVGYSSCITLLTLDYIPRTCNAEELQFRRVAVPRSCFLCQDWWRFYCGRSGNTKILSWLTLRGQLHVYTSFVVIWDRRTVIPAGSQGRMPYLTPRPFPGNYRPCYTYRLRAYIRKVTEEMKEDEEVLRKIHHALMEVCPPYTWYPRSPFVSVKAFYYKCYDSS